MKKFGIISVMTAIMLVASFANAQSDLLTADYSSAGWSKSYQDESVGLPEGMTKKTEGTLIRTFSVARDTFGTGVGYLKVGDTTNNLWLPSNAVVHQVWFDIITAQLPTTNWVQFGLNTTNDLLAFQTNWYATGIKAGIPVGTAATAVKATDNRNIQYTVIGTITQLVGKVWIEYFQSQ